MKHIVLILFILFNMNISMAQNDDCPGLATRLQTGDFAQVTPGLSNRLRAEPSPGSRQIGLIPSEYTVTILSGPVCEGTRLWWEVNYQGKTGWTVEIINNEYVLTPLISLEFGGIRFALPDNYDETLFASELVPPDTGDGTAPVSHPEYLHVYSVDETQGFDLRVYPLGAYAEVEPYVGGIIAELRNLLDERPTLEKMTNLPYVLRLGSAQVFVGRAAYVDGANIRGIHYLTRFSQMFSPLQRDSLLYTFQGITGDGLYYVSFTVPVNVDVLPDTGDPVPFTLNEDEIETYQRYVEERRRIVDNASPESIQPSMTNLSQIALTLHVGTLDPVAGEQVSFQGISFSLPSFIESATIRPFRHENSIQFLLGDEPYLTIYPTANLINADPSPQSTIATLQDMLTEHPDFQAESMLCLPYLINPGAFQDIAVRARYVSGEELEGVAYLTHFSQQFQPYGRDSLHYTLQGIIGEYYVIVNFPVEVESLSDNPDHFIFGESGPDWDAIDSYYTDIVALLNELPPNQIEPPMEAIDAMVSSLRIDAHMLAFGPTPLDFHGWAPPLCYPGLNTP
ncbi:MAG: SH3 domain-containing protein [Anaerolineaceae bacterium]|nr:SH3 domain-containing protein [Anaerolineaceae bacterium]